MMSASEISRRCAFLALALFPVGCRESNAPERPAAQSAAEDAAYFDIHTFAVQAWQAEVDRVRTALKADPHDSSMNFALGWALIHLADATPAAARRSALRNEAAEAMRRAHEVAGGDYLTDPQTGRIISLAEANRRFPVAADGRVDGLPGVRRASDGRWVKEQLDGRTVLVGGPGNVEALSAAADVLLAEGQVQPARDLLEQLRRVRPYSYVIPCGTAYAKGLGDGDWTAAEAELRRLSYRSEAQNAGSIWRWLAYACARLDRPGDAALACAQALRLSPDSCEMLDLLAEVRPTESKAAGESRAASVSTRETYAVQARAEGKVRTGDWKGAWDEYAGLLEREPRHGDSWDGLALIYRNLDQAPVAIAASERALKYQPTRFQFQLQYGVSLAAAGRREEAEQAFLRALEQDARLSDLLVARARNLMEMGRPDAAAELLDRVTEARPFDVLLWVRLGDALMEGRRYDDAMVAYRNGMRWRRDDPRLLQRIARVYEARGDDDRAMRWFVKALEAGPEEGDVLQDLRRFVNRRGLYREFINTLDLLIEGHARPSILYSNRAMAWVMLDHCDRAQADFDRAVDLVLPELRYAALVSRGQFHMLRGNDDAAVADLTEAMNRQDTLLHSALWLWIIHQRHGRTDEARRVVNETLDRAGWDLHATRLLRYYLDEIDRDLLVALAEDEPQRCEIDFYIGARAMVEGRQDEAYDWFFKCAQTLVTEYYEYGMAVYYLRQARAQGLWKMPDSQPARPADHGATPDAAATNAEDN